MMRRHCTLIVMIVLFVGVPPAFASELLLNFELVDKDPARHQITVRMHFVLDPNPECAPATSCDVRNAAAVQISPCPSNAPVCAGNTGLWFVQSQSETQLDAITLVLDTELTYDMVGEWDLRRWTEGMGDCDLLDCSVLHALDRLLVPTELVVTEQEDWGTWKARFH